MTATATPTNTKAGWCSMCRRSQHSICASDTCACTFERHRNRPSQRAASDANGTGATARNRATNRAVKLTEPVWELVKAEPPAPPPRPKRLTAAERARPLLEQVMAEESKEWHRLALFPKPLQASYVASQLRKHYRREWEFKPHKLAEVGQSALYARWLGPNGNRNGQL